LLAPVKTPVDSPRTIPTDILQTGECSSVCDRLPRLSSRGFKADGFAVNSLRYHQYMLPCTPVSLMNIPTWFMLQTCECYRRVHCWSTLPL
jgi:hypothetical protein